jgi:hypothetical protein
VWRMQLARFVEEWRLASKSEKKTALLPGKHLARARHWLMTHRSSLAADELSFILASSTQERERKIKLGAVAVVALSLLFPFTAVGMYSGYVATVEEKCIDYSGRWISEMAILLCLHALQFDEKPNVMDALAVSYARQGRIMEAKMWLQRALKLGYDDSFRHLVDIYSVGRSKQSVLLIYDIKNVRLEDEARARWYVSADQTANISNDPNMIGVLQSELAIRKFLSNQEAMDDWSTDFGRALSADKKDRAIEKDVGITPRVIDMLTRLEDREMNHPYRFDRR